MRANLTHLKRTRSAPRSVEDQKHLPNTTRAACRSKYKPDERHNHLGFRVVFNLD